MRSLFLGRGYLNMTSTYLIQNAGKWFGIDRFGHTVDRHFNMPDTYLKRRSLSHNKRMTSTFVNCTLVDIYEMVLDAITNSADEIVDWMDDWLDDGCWGLYVNLPKNIKGRQYIKDTDSYYDCDMALIILEKCSDRRRIKIATAFPYSRNYEPAIEN